MAKQVLLLVLTLGLAVAGRSAAVFGSSPISATYTIAIWAVDEY